MASDNPDEAPKRLSSDESLWGNQEKKRKRGGPAFGVRVDEVSEEEPGGTRVEQELDRLSVSE